MDSTGQASDAGVDRNTIRLAYEFVLGRDPEGDHVFATLEGRPLPFVLAAFFEGPEFADNVRRPIGRHVPPAGGHFDRPPSSTLRDWLVATLPLEAGTAVRVRTAPTWAALYEALFEDAGFRGFIGLTYGPWTPFQRRALKALATQPDGTGREAAIEEIGAGRVRGWAVDAAAPDRPLTIEFWLDDTFLSATVADGFRRDVQDRFGGDGLTGYSCELPERRGGLTPGGLLEVRDALSRRVLASARLPDQAPAVGPHESVRAELAHIRAVLERLEAAVPALASLQGFALEDYADYFEAFYRPARSETGPAPDRPAADACVISDVSGAPAGDVEDLVWSVVDQMTPPVALRLRGVETGVAEILPDLVNRIDWSGRLGRPSSGWLVVDEAVPETSVHVLLRRPGVLAPDAVHRFVDALGDPDVQAVYADEDRMAPSGPADRARRLDPRFKSGFDPDLLLQTPYVGGCVAFRADALDGIDPFGGPLGVEAAVLSLSLRGARIAHVPRVLWSERAAAEPGAGDWEAVVRGALADRPDLSVEPYADELGARPAGGAVRVRRAVPDAASATVVIPTRDRLDLLGPCVDSLLAARPYNRTRLEIALVDHQTTEPEAVAFLRSLSDREGVRVDRHEGAFNWALMNNLAAARSQADVLVFLNNDTRVLTPDWLDELVAQAMRPDVGVVGPRLLYEDGTLQHGGLIARDRVEHYVGHEGVGLAGSDGGYLDRYSLVRRAAAVYGACMAIRRDRFQALGGFDSARLGVEGNDVDLCLKAQAAGLAVLYTPHATLYHLESKSRGFARSGQALEISRAANQVVWDRWAGRGLADDLYNPHFDREARPFTRLRPPVLGWPS